MLCPVLGLSVFVVSLCRVPGLSDVGLPDVGLFWKWVSAAFGKVLDQAGHKSPTQAPQHRACAKEKYIRGELNIRMVLVVP